MTDSAYLKKKEKKMRVLEKFALIKEVATKLADMNDAKQVNDFLDALEIPTVEATADITLKDRVLLRLKGITDDKLIHMARYELEMNLDKFPSITPLHAF